MLYFLTLFFKISVRFVNKMYVGKMHQDKMSVDEMSADKMACCRAIEIIKKERKNGPSSISEKSLQC